jgi:hypothetical protein
MNGGNKTKQVRRVVSALYGLGILTLSGFIIGYNAKIGELADNFLLWIPVVVCGLLVLFAALVNRAYLLVAIVSILNIGIFSLLLTVIILLDKSMFSTFRTWGAVPLWVVPIVVLIVIIRGR